MTSKQQEFDIAFIGAGLSSTATLQRLAEQLRERLRPSPLKIAVIEKSGQFFSGIAYGDRSGPTSLIITPLDEFLPSQELEPFVAWMQDHQDRLADGLESKGGALSRDLARRFKQALKDGTWSKIHVPRAFYGQYLAEQTTALLEETRKAGLIDCHLIHADIAALDRVADGYRIQMTSGEASIDSRSVVLGLGTPPPRKLFAACGGEEIASRLVEDPYSPSMPDNLTRVAQTLEAVPDELTPNVLLIGANASCLEMLYLLCDQSSTDRRQPTYHVLSPQGKMPERFVGVETLRFEARHLSDLMTEETVTAAAILEAVKADLRVARSASLGIGETLPVLSRIIGKLATDRLSAAEQQAFVDHVGVAIGRIQRRAGEEYSDIIDKLGEQGRLHIVNGSFLTAEKRDDGHLRIDYRESASGEGKTLDQPMAVAINCSGSAGLERPNSCPLIESLLESGLCLANGSSFGFKVNDNMEANDNLYVIGPMLAGNVVAGTPIWHVEHCGRILHFSNKLADELLFKSSCDVAAE